MIEADENGLVTVPEIVIYRILMRIGARIEEKAKRLVPIDYALLKNSITMSVSGNVVTVSANTDYASDLEYGTPPGVLSSKEKTHLKDWARRHDMGENYMVGKIQREGIKVGTPDNPMKTPSGYRPYLRPALYRTIRQDLRKIISEEFERWFKEVGNI